MGRGVEAHRAHVDLREVDAARPEVALGQGAPDRPPGREQTSRHRDCVGVAEAAVGRAALGRRGAGECQEGASLVHGIAECAEATIEPDEVEQVAVLAGGGVGLMCSCT